MTSDAALDRALHAVGRTRVLGLHFFGHFIGVRGRTENGTARLEIEGEPAGGDTTIVSGVSLAAFADLALGAAIRSQLGPGTRPATIAISLQHHAARVSGPLVATASASQVSEGYWATTCSITHGSETVAEASGCFTALTPPPGVVMRPAPWNQPEPHVVPVPTMDELDEFESAAVAAARVAGSRAAQRWTAVSQELLPFEWHDHSTDRSLGTVRLGPHLSNRVGHVQGGILYGGAALAAARALDAEDATLCAGHFQFHRPAKGATLTAAAETLKRGGRVAFVESRLAVDDATVGVGLFTFRLPGGRAQS